MHEMILFSDHHAHNHNYGAKRRELDRGDKVSIHNSRLLDSVAVLDDINNYARLNNISTLVFCGDLFHTRGSVPTDVVNLTYDAIERMSEGHNRRLWMIPGNHDFADREGVVHSLEPLKSLPNVTVFDAATSDGCKLDIQFHFVPYSDNKQKVLDDIASIHLHPGRRNILIGHAGFQGAMVGSNYVLVNDSDLALGEVDISKFDACFFGHFHKHQKLAPNAWYVGATHQHNWGDSGDWRGFLHVTIEKNGAVKIKPIESKAPKFVNLYSEDELADYSNDYVRLHLGPNVLVGDEEGLELWKKAMDYPRRVEVIPSKEIEEGVTEDENEIEVFNVDTIVPSNLVSFWNAMKGREPEQSAVGLALLAEAEERMN